MPQPIAIIINDTHLHKNNIDQVKDIFRQVCNKAKELGINTILHGGDFFTNRIGQPQSVLLAAHEIFSYIKFKKYNFYAISGNHDKTDNNAKESYLDIFSSDYIHIFDDGLPQTLQNVDFDNLKVHFLPYFNENFNTYSNFLQEINKNLDKNKKNVLITHIGMNGAKNNDGSTVKNNITTDLFKDFDLVSIGHYHNRQRINDQIYYTGSAFPQNFGEDNDKGVIILYDDASFDYYNLEFPYYIKYTYHPNEITNDVLSKLQSESENNYVRVALKGKQSEVKSFDKGILEDIGVDVKSEIEEVQQNIESANNFKVHNVSSIQEEFSKFAEESEMKDDKVEKEKEYLKQIQN